MLMEVRLRVCVCVYKYVCMYMQKKLQEEAMADGADKLAAGMAGMDVKDPADNMSMGSSSAETVSDIFGVGSILAQVGVFAAVYSAMNLCL